MAEARAGRLGQATPQPEPAPIDPVLPVRPGRVRRWLARILVPFLAVALGLAVGAIAIVAAGGSVVDAYRELIIGAVGTPSNLAATLARAVPKMLLEERFHSEHAEGWVRLIETEPGPPRDALRRALGRALADTSAFFGPPGHDAELVRSGVRTQDDDALRRRLCSRLAKLIAEPEAVGLVSDGDGWSSPGMEWSGWDPNRRRIAGGGPDQAMLDELRGTKNVAFKSA